jgi:hypothetical protein
VTDLALTTLEEIGWLKVERLATGGRQAQIVRLNPYLEIVGEG